MSPPSPSTSSHPADDPAPPRAWRDPFVILAALTVCLFVVWIAPVHIAALQDPYSVNDDMRVSVGFFASDLPAPPNAAAQQTFDYQRRRSPGYAVLIAAIKLKTDPWEVAKVGALILFVAMVIPLALVGRLIAGPAGAWAMVGLALHGEVFFGRAAGMMPRAFVFPVLAWMLYALVARRDILLLWLIPLGTAFYPPVCLFGGGAAIGRVLWVWRDGELHTKWPRAVVHALVAFLLTAALSRYVAEEMTEKRLFTIAEAAEMPELGPDGRGPLVVPLPPIRHDVMDAAGAGLTRLPWAFHRWRVQVPLALMGLGLLVLWGRLPRNAVLACCCLAVPAALAYGLARIVAFSLYVPNRYLLYSGPLLVIVLWLLVWTGVFKRWWPSARAASAGAWCSMLAAGVIGGPGVPGQVSYTIRPGQLAPLLPVIERLSPEILLSGPADDMDTLFAFAHRYTYISNESFAPIRPADWPWMSGRFRRHLAAYYAADWADVDPLREAGVTHMVVRLADFRTDEPRDDDLGYEPFRSEVQQLRTAHGERGFVFAHPPPWSVVARTDSYLLVDLRKVPGGEAPARDSPQERPDVPSPVQRRPTSPD